MRLQATRAELIKQLAYWRNLCLVYDARIEQLQSELLTDPNVREIDRLRNVVATLQEQLSPKLVNPITGVCDASK